MAARTGVDSHLQLIRFCIELLTHLFQRIVRLIASQAGLVFSAKICPEWVDFSCDSTPNPQNQYDFCHNFSLKDRCRLGEWNSARHAGVKSSCRAPSRIHNRWAWPRPQYMIPIIHRIPLCLPPCYIKRRPESFACSDLKKINNNE